MSRYLARHRSARDKDLVGFEVGGIHYAVGIGVVREIINPVELFELPGAPPSVVGVADHRGSVVPLVDMRRRFGLEAKAATGRTKWVIVKLGSGGWAGLVVDGVTDVFAGDPEQKRPLPELDGPRAGAIRDVFATATGLVFVLDVDQVAAPSENLDLSRAGKP